MANYHEFRQAVIHELLWEDGVDAATEDLPTCYTDKQMQHIVATMPEEYYYILQAPTLLQTLESLAYQICLETQTPNNWR